MDQLVNELSRLGDNSPLFDLLRAGGDLTALAGRLPDSAVPSKTVKGELLRSFRAAIVPALQSGDHSRLDKLLAEADVNAWVVIFGELVLTLYALREGKHPGATVEAIQNRAIQLARDLARAFEAAQPQDTDDEQLRAHAVAMREWAHLL